MLALFQQVRATRCRSGPIHAQAALAPVHCAVPAPPATEREGEVGGTNGVSSSPQAVSPPLPFEAVATPHGAVRRLERE